MNESVILRSILDYLKLKSKTENIYYFRAGSGAIRMANGRYFKTGRPGAPDICCCIDGKFVGLEVKTPSGRQSRDQKKAEVDITMAGGHYFIVRSIGDVKHAIKTLSAKST